MEQNNYKIYTVFFIFIMLCFNLHRLALCQVDSKYLVKIKYLVSFYQISGWIYIFVFQYNLCSYLNHIFSWYVWLSFNHDQFIQLAKWLKWHLQILCILVYVACLDLIILDSFVVEGGNGSLFSAFLKLFPVSA